MYDKITLYRIQQRIMKVIYRILMTVPFLLFILKPTFSQEKNLVNQGQYWFGYSLSKKINEDWSVKVSTEDRRYFINNRNHMFYVQGDVSYKVNDKLSFTTGLMFFQLNRPSDPHIETIVNQPEFRPFQKISLKLASNPKQSVIYSLSLEERFRMHIANNEQQDYYNMYFRFRNKLQYKRRLSAPSASHPISAFVYDDFMIHLGSTVKGSPFDQNRFAFGLEWKASSHTTLRTGYLNWYQEIAGSTTVFERNIVTFSMAQSF